MIVIGVDVHKQSPTAVAVDELGRAVAEYAGAAHRRDLSERNGTVLAMRLVVARCEVRYTARLIAWLCADDAGGSPAG